MKLPRLFSIVLVTALLSGQNALATYTPSPSGSTYAPAPSSSETPTRNGLHGSLGINVSSGTMSNQTGSVASRALNSVSGTAQLGLKSAYLEPFLYGEYEYAQQATPASQVSNTNLSGSGYLAGAGLAFEVSGLRLSAAYIGFGKFTSTQATVNGQSSNYSDPSGFRFALDIGVGRSLLLIASYRTAQFRTFDQNTGSTDISANKLSYSKAGLGLAWGF